MAVLGIDVHVSEATHVSAAWMDDDAINWKAMYRRASLIAPHETAERRCIHAALSRTTWTRTFCPRDQDQPDFRASPKDPNCFATNGLEI
jgi:hypothetical protein